MSSHMPSAAKERRRRLSPAQRRSMIVIAAMEVFAERGYERASMSEIARRAGITAAVIYDYFSSKAVLQVELLENQTNELLGYVATALLEAPDEPATQMRAGVDAFFRFVEEHRYAWRMLFRDPPLDPEVAAAYTKLERQATSAIALLIETNAGDALARYGNPSQTAEVFAEALKAAQNALAAWWYEHSEIPREEIVARLLDLTWTGLEHVSRRSPEGAR